MQQFVVKSNATIDATRFFFWQVWLRYPGVRHLKQIPFSLALVNRLDAVFNPAKILQSLEECSPLHVARVNFTALIVTSRCLAGPDKVF